MISGDYQDVTYLQFNASRAFRFVQASIGVAFWPLVWPLAMISRSSDIFFRTCSELLSIVPYFPGVIMRYEFYRFALHSCGKNVVIEFGTVFIYPQIAVGNNVLIGRYSIVHHCDLHDYSLIGERCTLLSGSRQHSFARSDVPMALQGGMRKHIELGPDCWIGSHSVIMDSIGRGAIVAAGTVVNKPVADNQIVAGSAQRVIGDRAGATDEG